ncbi:MAG: P-loop NTPase, partial [Gemmatimonadota bacterium]
ACPDCGETGTLFPGDAGRRLAERHDVPLLGRIPFDPEAARLAETGDLSELIGGTSAGAALVPVVDAVLEAIA